MSTTSPAKTCPQCGGSIPPEAPQGLCPKCLLAQAALATEAGPSASAKPTPPSLAELSPAFPHLEILELIGQGGMGFVFKARQPKLDRFVALKILPQSFSADPAFAERFTREGRVLARLNHPNIVTIHDFGQANGFFYLLMEYVDGVNLRQAMKAGRFTPEQALAIVPKICEALQFAHNEGILHRDIKPENILLDAKGRVKIADFGIAKLLDRGSVSRSNADSQSAPESSGSSVSGEAAAGHRPAVHNLTETGKVLGTPDYMAPEQRERPQEVDHRADIYSLGVVFYEMLTGELPLGRFAPPSQRSAADPRVDEVVMRALQKEKARRPASAEEVRTQVETITGTSDRSRGGTEVLPTLPNSERQKLEDLTMAVRNRHLSWLRSAKWVAIVLATLVFAWFVAGAFRSNHQLCSATAVIALVNQPADSANARRPAADDIETLVKSPIVLDAVVSNLNLSAAYAAKGGRFTLSPNEARQRLAGRLDVFQIPRTASYQVRVASDSPEEAVSVADEIANRLVTVTRHDVQLPGNRVIEITDGAALDPDHRNANVLLNFGVGIIAALAIGVLVYWLLLLLIQLSLWWRRRSPYAQFRLFSFSRRNLWKVAIVLAVGLILILAQKHAIRRNLGLKTSPPATLNDAEKSFFQFRRILANTETNIPADVLPNPLDSHVLPLRVEKKSLMDATSLQRARLNWDSTSKEWQISFQLTPEGKARFAQITRTNIGRQLAIVVGGRVVSAPRIRSEISGGSGAISGNFSLTEAADLVVLLNRPHSKTTDLDQHKFTLLFDPQKALAGQPSLIDLDSGQVLTWPKEIGDWNKWRIGRWIAASGADLIALAPPPNSRMGIFATVLAPLEASAWNNHRSRAALLEILTQARSTEPLATNTIPEMHEALSAIPIDRPLPATYAFCTAEGNVGLLQITGFTETPRDMEIRYQLAQTETK
ncbi:MAG: protein kinase domain-containing protein [Verrucomicrobiota bacterium]